jgi:hypothetical protein
MKPSGKIGNDHVEENIRIGSVVVLKRVKKMSEKKNNSPQKKRSKKRMSKKQARITAFTFGILLILLSLLGFYLHFYVEGRILLAFPGLANEVTFTDLLESPNAYENEWIKIKGRIQYIHYINAGKQVK